MQKQGGEWQAEPFASSSVRDRRLIFENDVAAEDVSIGSGNQTFADGFNFNDKASSTIKDNTDRAWMIPGI